MPWPSRLNTCDVRCHNFNETRVIKTHHDPLHGSPHDFVEESPCCRQRVAIKNTNPSRTRESCRRNHNLWETLWLCPLFFFYAGRFAPCPSSRVTESQTRRVVSANIELCNYWHSKRRGRYRDARHRPTNVDTYTSQCVKIIISLRLHGKRNVTRRQSRDETPLRRGRRKKGRVSGTPLGFFSFLRRG